MVTFQLMKQNPVTIAEKLKVHFHEVFNVMDVFGIATFLAYFILKVKKSFLRLKLMQVLTEHCSLRSGLKLPKL